MKESHLEIEGTVQTVLPGTMFRVELENKHLVLEYFSEGKLAKIQLHRRISESLKTTQTALRMRVMRIKRQLRECVQECVNAGDVTSSTRIAH